ncbi:MAG: HAMP domain-containing sensor histidine kinase [Candidatus Aminicenantes bacterium]|nr:HAMP domain-containing sensor histidine kinase [Candidatus Aminicenantes bacterium]
MPLKARKARLRPGSRLLVMFFAITFLLVAALAWMGWQLMRQDRALAGQRLEEKRENAADLAVAALQKNLSQLESRLMRLSTAAAAQLRAQAAEYAAGLPKDSLLLIIRPNDLECYPEHRLLFYPNTPTTPAAGHPAFAAAEALEFQKQDYAKAVAALRPLARHADPAVRAEAQARLGRNLWKSGLATEALAAYDELTRAGSTPVAGLPAELVAREARLLAFEKQKDVEAARREAAALSAALRGGKWRIDRAAYDFYLSEACRGMGLTSLEPAEALAASAAAGSMWAEWRSLRRAEDTIAGRRIFWQADQPVLLAWRGTPERLAVFALGRRTLESQWLEPLLPTLGRFDARVVLTDSDGRAVSGRLPNGSEAQAVRLASSAQLPWTLHAVSAGGAATAGWAARRLVVTGLATLFLLVLAGAYFIGRAASREVAVARLESDFVASVSHEFRTPITALRQLSELLVSGRVESDEDRQEYYRALAQASERLHRLVEGLLTFGRLEAGEMPFRFEPLDATEWLRSVIEEFRRDAGANGGRIAMHTDGSAPRLRADPAALGCVISNLLDNAVKYSPDGSPIRVELGREDRRVVIRVRDQGLGISESEQKLIFRRFVRGTAAKTAGIRGAGVGLAMARQIANAHGGDITVDSRPGQGSTFTVRLPEGE